MRTRTMKSSEFIAKQFVNLSSITKAWKVMLPTLEKVAEVGDITTVISFEGFEKETDECRGNGTYKKILTAFKNFRNTGVPFGIFVTVTSDNAELLAPIWKEKYLESNKKKDKK